MKINLTLSLALLTMAGFSQVPGIQWQKCVGGSQNDYSTRIRSTSDGGYVMITNSESNDGDCVMNKGDQDAWVMKLNNTGSIAWKIDLGGSDIDVLNDIQETSDHGFITCGYTYSNDGDVPGNRGLTDCWAVKLDSTGVVEWSKNYGGSSYDLAYSIRQLTNGTYVFASQARYNGGDVSGNHGFYDYWVVNLDASGSIIWQKSLGGGGDDVPAGISLTSDGGLIVIGWTVSQDGDVTGTNNQSPDIWVVKLNATGGLVWQKCYGGSTTDEATAIIQTSDGGYIFGGHTFSLNGDISGHHNTSQLFGSDGWVVKIDAIGNLQWQKCLGGTNYERDAADLLQTPDGGYIVTIRGNSIDGDTPDMHYTPGSTLNWTTPNDISVYKLSATGQLDWQKCIGGFENEEVSSIDKTIDGAYIISGSTKSNDGDVSGNHNVQSTDAWIVKLAFNLVGESAMDMGKDISFYPNPNDGRFKITTHTFPPTRIVIYNMIGQPVYCGSSAQNISFSIDISSQPAGIYMVELSNEQGKVFKKIKKE